MALLNRNVTPGVAREVSNGVQTAVAEDFGQRLRTFQEVMFPAAYGDLSREWTHLVLTKVFPHLFNCSILRVMLGSLLREGSVQ